MVGHVKRNAARKDRSTGQSDFIGGGAPFTVTAEMRGERAVIAAVGEVDRETSSSLAAAIDSAAQTCRSIDLDLAGVVFMDSQGLRVIVEAKGAVGPNTSIFVTEASQQVTQLLAMTGLAEFFARPSTSPGHRDMGDHESTTTQPKE